ncbi:MAG TPA: bifunctional phosphopantothenoylcysteine decarboxylase/phosphopantothenate--cysteine ligase CoaBC [Saprospiraceae bacterium]|jgi:phosphopantothenoylcysteine decarboxylase/phosphopantothenate--cysteine ligase|nr:bifunctional phosphopantothenoylcysteine decarboxylase/phosphopantothenate--cysteine ligase CoaBC [Saprospiraceae bacterium]HRN32921.1 bifunctional phosphopantothenoylcysteine decarboxylase/phosphopantothenate--cysteine ligase CoaBC [Saprospiraceae bacterium]
MELQGKKIVLGICGSIAAYKAAFLCRLLIKKGAEVRVVMTPSASDFITPVTMSTLSNHSVYNSIHDGNTWAGHVDLGLWADLILIAPASANTIAHMANGICQTMLDAVCLSAKCTVCVAPAMDLDMWKYPATVANINRLRSFGTQIIPVEHGFLASGLIGDGRMAEPEHILAYVIDYFNRGKDLLGQKVLITAGPTHEKIDPVRFIGNASSGKMGIALAFECLRRGATVDLVLGPASENPAAALGMTIHHVTDSEEMYLKCFNLYPDTDIAILAAAVADYRPIEPSEQKIKKTEDTLSITLQKTKDIAAELGRIKPAGKIHVGFALETDNELEYAIAKRKRKNFDLIVLNSTRDKGATFGSDNNKVTILGESGIIRKTELLPKTEIATIIIDETIKLLKKSL